MTPAAFVSVTSAVTITIPVTIAVSITASVAIAIPSSVSGKSGRTPAAAPRIITPPILIARAIS
jgi:hypothetical protein